MKIGAFILTAIWGLLLVQPAFAYFGAKPAYGDCPEPVTSKPTCSKSKPARSTCSENKVATPICSKKKCNKPSKSQDKNNCMTDGCNPTLGCSSGNFYIHYHSQISLPLLFAQKQKLIVTDDNRIMKCMSECWHPPEA